MSDVVPESLTTHEAGQHARKLQILQAATECFVKSGFHGTSMHEICQAAGMSPGALYRYFKSKDDIILAIADDEQAQNSKILARRPEGVGFVDHLVNLGIAFFGKMTKPGAAALLAEVFAESLRNSAIGERFKTKDCNSREVFAQLVREAVEAGEIREPEDFEMAISFLKATGEGLAIRMAFDPALTIERVEPILRRVAHSLFPPAGSVPHDRSDETEKT